MNEVCSYRGDSNDEIVSRSQIYKDLHVGLLYEPLDEPSFSAHNQQHS